MENHNHHTCPWWLLFTFDNPLRKLIHDPIQILKPYIQLGSSALDVGCGMGYFTLAIAELAGKNGHVYAADLQPQMLTGLRRRAIKKDLLERIDLIQCSFDRIGITTEVDFTLAFWMVHEVEDQKSFLTEIYENLKSGGKLLIVEPKLHVSKSDFARTINIGEEIGFMAGESPDVRLSQTIILTKPA